MTDTDRAIVFHALEELSTVQYAYKDHVRGAIEKVIRQRSLTPTVSRDELYARTASGLSAMFSMPL